MRSSRPTHVRWANERLTYLFWNVWPSSHRLSRLLTFSPILTFDFWPHGSFWAYENLFWTGTALTDVYKRHFLADWLTFLLVWQGIFSLSYFASFNTYSTKWFIYLFLLCIIFHFYACFSSTSFNIFTYSLVLFTYLIYSFMFISFIYLFIWVYLWIYWYTYSYISVYFFVYQCFIYSIIHAFIDF